MHYDALVRRKQQGSIKELSHAQAWLRRYVQHTFLTHARRLTRHPTLFLL